MNSYRASPAKTREEERPEHQNSNMHTLRVNKVDDSLVLEDVHFFNSGDGVNTKSLQGVLQSLVICGGGLMHRFLLPGKEQ